MFSSIKLAVRRCLLPGRARRCFLVISVVSLTSLWMLVMQVSQPKASSDLDKFNRQAAMMKDAPLVRTAMPLKVTAKETGPIGVIPAKEIARQLQNHHIDDQPVYKTVGKVIKETEDWILVFVESPQSGRSILNVLWSHRFKVKVVSVHGNMWPSLVRGEKGIFSVFIFESLKSYSHLSSLKAKVLEEYCWTYGVGMVIFSQPDVVNDFKQIRQYPLFVDKHVRLKDPIFNQSSGIPRITRANQRFVGNLPGNSWTTFRTNHSTFVPVMEARVAVPQQNLPLFNASGASESRTCVLYDRGWLDGIKRIYFGYSADQFMLSMLLLDSVAHLTQGRLQTALNRYVLIDIDDIFVGRTGIRLKESDVESLVSIQAELQELMPGFHFNLGFSGKYFQRGTEEENRGDQRIVDQAHHFWWFPHMWDHMQPHFTGSTAKLMEGMYKNKLFAEEHGIPITKGYSVAPHHSGVYPVHEELYDAWKEVWGIEATSTEEYPHIKPAYKRKGFVYKDVMVIPRQTCALYTHTNFYEEFRGGKPALDAMIQGGELFSTLLHNPVNVFMTHMSNYGSDRLATYTFKRAFQFVKTYTNLQLQTLPPVATAKKYFELYPEEREPLWGNPCEDKRHVEIWAENKDCTKLPNSLILGPQKTGTTALHAFLLMHKKIVSNRPSEKTYEEVQFFNGQNYYNGLDWYLDFFPSNKNRTHVHVFEKSANYFDSPLAPKRVKALLPKAKLIVILKDPALRAYSWYHHMRAHNDPASLQYSFRDVVMARPDASKPLRDLQRRCLEPGKYATHLERWLQYFPAGKQILLLDGDQLKDDPPQAMQKVQKFLKIKPALDYSKMLKYDAQKGFFCPVGPRNHVHCLGKGKGRKYPEMDEESAEYLKGYYRQENLLLSAVLERFNQASPQWLSSQLEDF
ncbi:bifunctional heparan sulfate N-deacetylase/N-sulfotransferase 1-like [Diadema antillarum]|uniref:bifunctional heparan sulfate N-deacetylase/N-sulfotransferase 1-like n=1 Tax=Diadema antillarum TaxID=105358 RepID=UPI003A872050